MTCWLNKLYLTEIIVNYQQEAYRFYFCRCIFDAAYLVISLSRLFFCVSLSRPELMQIFGDETSICPRTGRSPNPYRSGTEHLWPFPGLSHQCRTLKQMLHVYAAPFKWAVGSSIWEAGWWDAGRPGWILWRPDWCSFHWSRLWRRLFSKSASCTLWPLWSRNSVWRPKATKLNQEAQDNTGPTSAVFTIEPIFWLPLLNFNHYVFTLNISNMK